MGEVLIGEPVSSLGGNTAAYESANNGITNIKGGRKRRRSQKTKAKRKRVRKTTAKKWWNIFSK